jgi:hypothetical protein
VKRLALLCVALAVVLLLARVSTDEAGALSAQDSLAAFTPKSFLLRLHDAVWVAGTRIACVVETRTGAQTNALICFKRTAKSFSIQAEPRSDLLLLAEHGVSVANITTRKVLFEWFSSARLSTEPKGIANANPLAGGVALLHLGDQIFVENTHVRCGVIKVSAPAVILLVCNLAVRRGVPLGSYVAGLGDAAIQVLGPAGPNEKKLFVARLP